MLLLVIAQSQSTGWERYVPHDFKDVVALLVLLVTIYLSVKIPEQRRRRDLAVDLFKLFNSDGMVAARQSTWRYLRGLDSEQSITIEQRVELFWRLTLGCKLNEQPYLDKVCKEDIYRGMISTRRIFDFLGACETAVSQRIVDEKTTHCIDAADV